MILFAILLYLFFPEVFSLSSILKIIVILLIWDIFWAAIRVKNKSFNREVKRHIDKQKKELYRNLKKDNFLQESDIFDGIKITDKKTGTQYTFEIEESVLEREDE